MPLVLGSLGAIIALYFVLAIARPFLPWKVCAICAAVGLTWAGLLIGYFLDWHNDAFIIGILMGGSVVGIMYRVERYFKMKQFANFWAIRLYIVIVGFLVIYLLLTARYDFLVTVAVFAIIFGFFTVFFSKPLQTNEKGAEVSRPGKTLRKKLDHCCD